MPHYSYRTRHGIWRIARRHDGRWEAMFEDEALDSYLTAQQALDDLAGGHTDTPSTGVDGAAAGLPDDLSEWSFSPR